MSRRGFAHAEALIEKTALHRIARQRQRRTEVLARGRVSPAAKLKLAERRGVKRIGGEAISVFDRADRLEPALQTVALRDRYRAVERHDRGRTYRHQSVVEGNDRPPVRLFRL